MELNDVVNVTNAWNAAHILSCPPLQRSWKGVYWFHVVRPSVRPSVCPSVCGRIRVCSVSIVRVIMGQRGVFSECRCSSCSSSSSSLSVFYIQSLLVTVHITTKNRACYFVRLYHWNGNVFILIRFWSLAASDVVKMTISSAASGENFVKMTTFSLQWYARHLLYLAMIFISHANNICPIARPPVMVRYEGVLGGSRLHPCPLIVVDLLSPFINRDQLTW